MLSVAILAGGLATRLRPVTESIPKSLIEVAGEPFLAHQLRLLADREHAVGTVPEGGRFSELGLPMRYLDLDEPIFYGVADERGGVANRYLDHNVLMPDGRKFAKSR